MGMSSLPAEAAGATFKGDTGAAIQIERVAGGEVVVRVVYSEEDRRQGLKIVRVICLGSLVAVLVLAGLYYLGIIGIFMAVGFACFAVGIASTFIWQFFVVRPSYVLRADHTGLTVERSTSGPPVVQHFTLGQITDIGVAFSFQNRPIQCWLYIDTTVRRPICCLHNLGGNHLARIADILRSALRLPIRSRP